MDHERRPPRCAVGELRSEVFDEGVEVVALVLSEAARRDHFLDVRIYVRVGRVRGERGAGAEEDRDDERYEQSLCPRQQNQGASGPGPRLDVSQGNDLINALV